MADVRLVTVAVAPSQTIGAMWQELLAGEGIPAVLRSTDGVAYFGASSPSHLLVPAEQADHARAILAAFTEQDAPPSDG